jgi:hypothetical protein
MNNPKLPVMIQDLITNLLDNRSHFEKRQFYASSALNIKNALDEALKSYEREREFKSAGRSNK